MRTARHADAYFFLRILWYVCVCVCVWVHCSDCMCYGPIVV